MRSKALLSFIAIVLVPLSASAQTTHRIISPSVYTNLEARSSNGHPAGFPNARYQYIHESVDLLIPHGGSIKAVGFRIDSGGSYTSYKAKLSIYLGSTTKTSTTLTKKFSANGAVGNYFKEKAIVMPTVAASKTKPSQNFVMYPLDRPFTFSSHKNLLVEYRTSTSVPTGPAGWYLLDYGGPSRTGTFKGGTFGTACPNSLKRTATLTASPWPLGQISSFHVKGAMPSAPGLFVIGVSNHAWGPIPLPLDLRPFGSPGCKLYTDVLISNLIATNSKGELVFFLRLDQSRSHNGLKVYGQYIYFDGASAGARLRSTNAAWVQATSGPRVGLLWAWGGTVPHTVGTYHPSYPIVCAFDYQ